jgi:hypothetical protein
VPEQTIGVGQSLRANPGDTFRFDPPDASTQYHFEVTPSEATLVIGCWKGSQAKGNGVARNKPGVPYVDHVCGAGSFVYSVAGATGPYAVKLTANSWFKRVFGWG